MPKQEPTTRIGEAERTAAQRALQEHLNAERLLVNEYAERSAAAAGATTAAEIAALFTDLPAPHPRLPGRPGGGTRRTLLVVSAVVAVALVGVLAFAVGRGGQTAPVAGTALAPVTPTAAPTSPSPSSATTTATPSASAGATTSASPDGTGRPLQGAQVRRTTGDRPITLSPFYSVDLDDSTSPNWSASRGCCGDVFFDDNSEYVTVSNDYAVMAGPADYAACAQETAYTTGRIERGGLTPGQEFCVRTDDDRFAVLTVVGADDQAFQFRATVWDPQFE